MMRTVYPLLYDDCIYEGFDSSSYPGQPSGWNDHLEHFKRLLNSESDLVIEVGSWLGNSALALCDAAPNAEVVCIDTWQGSQEMWDKHTDPNRYGALKLWHGYPQIYYSFLANVVRAGRRSRVTPMPLPSTVALRFLRSKGITAPDLIYIDGSHAFPDVRADIIGALHLKPRIICGDDYESWRGVRDAVNETLPGVNTEGEFWWLRL